MLMLQGMSFRSVLTPYSFSCDLCWAGEKYPAHARCRPLHPGACTVLKGQCDSMVGRPEFQF